MLIIFMVDKYTMYYIHTAMVATILTFKFVKRTFT